MIGGHRTGKWLRLHRMRVGCDVAALVLVGFAAVMN
jgi:hypothetical protein